MSFIESVSAGEMAAVDQAMFSHCGLDVLQVMEVAGRAVAVWIRQDVFDHDCQGRCIAVLYGSGGNGGDALVAARYLAGWGARPVLIGSSLPAPGTPAAVQHQIAHRLNIPEVDNDWNAADQCDLIVDGLLGFGSHGAPRGMAARLIETANQSPAPVVAIDTPSGLDATTGEVYTPCVEAKATVTLGLAKTGLLTEGGRRVAGRVIVADIGIPAAAFVTAGVQPPSWFWQSDFQEI